MFNPSLYWGFSSLGLCKGSSLFTFTKTLERSFWSSVIRLPLSLLRSLLPQFVWRPQVWWFCCFWVTLRTRNVWCGWSPWVWVLPPRHSSSLDFFYSGLLLSLVQTLSALGHPDFPALPGLRMSPFLLLPLKDPALLPYILLGTSCNGSLPKLERVCLADNLNSQPFNINFL